MKTYYYREEYKKGQSILYRDSSGFGTKKMAMKLWSSSTFVLPSNAPEGYDDCYLKLICRDDMTGEETILRKAHCKSLAYLERKEARKREKASRNTPGVD